MDGPRKWMTQLSQRLELPADVLAGVPRMELEGDGLFRMEPHKGLLEYSREQICVASSLGTVQICGSQLRIKVMNVSQITVCGRIGLVRVGESAHE